MSDEWTSQWHITGKGKVIRQWSKGEDPGERIYRELPTTRRPKLSDFDVLDEEIGRFDAVWSRITLVLVWLGALAILGAALGLFGLPMYGVANSVSLAVGVTSVVIIVLIPIVAIFIMRSLRTRVSRLYAEAGLTDPMGVVLPIAEAEVIVADPNTLTSSPVPAKAP
ncbi:MULTISPECIES: hypothetical protein [Brevibacterium]|uniref:DUF2207 domain-containing protein n=2 Tax=Brevibacterium TaxID=1696 RepID=A0ABP9U620_9MICO